MNSKDLTDASTSFAGVLGPGQQAPVSALLQSSSSMEDDSAGGPSNAASISREYPGGGSEANQLQDETENTEKIPFSRYRAGCSKEDQMETENQPSEDGDETMCSVSNFPGVNKDSEPELMDIGSGASGRPSTNGHTQQECEDAGRQSPMPGPSSASGQSQDIHKQDVKRDKRGRPPKPFQWLYRDMSFEEEYNIATEDGEDINDGRHARASPMPRGPEVSAQDVSKPILQQNKERQDGVAAKPKSRHYTEYHFYQWFRNSHPHYFRTKHMSFFVVYKPGKIVIAELKLGSLVERDITPMQSPKCGFFGKHKCQVCSKSGGLNESQTHSSIINRNLFKSSYRSGKTSVGSNIVNPVPSTSKETPGAVPPAEANDTVPSTSFKRNHPVPSTSKARHNYVSSTSSAIHNVSSTFSDTDIDESSTCRPSNDVTSTTHPVQSTSRTREVSSASSATNNVSSTTSNKNIFATTNSSETSNIVPSISRGKTEVSPIVNTTISSSGMTKELKAADSSMSSAVNVVKNKNPSDGKHSGTSSSSPSEGNSETSQISVRQASDIPCSSKDHIQNPQPSRWSYAAGDNQPSSTETPAENFTNHPLQDHDSDFLQDRGHNDRSLQLVSKPSSEMHEVVTTSTGHRSTDSTPNNSGEFPGPVASTSNWCPEGTKRSSGTSQDCPPNKLQKLQESSYDDGIESMET